MAGRVFFQILGARVVGNPRAVQSAVNWVGASAFVLSAGAAVSLVLNPGSLPQTMGTIVQVGKVNPYFVEIRTALQVRGPLHVTASVPGLVPDLDIELQPGVEWIRTPLEVSFSPSAFLVDEFIFPFIACARGLL